MLLLQISFLLLGNSDYLKGGGLWLLVPIKGEKLQVHITNGGVVGEKVKEQQHKAGGALLVVLDGGFW